MGPMPLQVANRLNKGTIDHRRSPVVTNETPASSEEFVRISLEMPRDIVAWIDGLNAQLGLRSRGETISRLIQEIRGEA